MTIDDIIGAILAREGGYVDDPADHGGATKYGITAATLGLWRALGRPATRDEVRALGVQEATEIYRQRYVRDPGFHRIVDDQLRAQLVDFGVNAGPARAIRWLQRVLGIPATGVLTDVTLAALAGQPARLVNDALVAARLYMVDSLTDADLSQKRFEEGLESRALQFFVSRPST